LDNKAFGIFDARCNHEGEWFFTISVISFWLQFQYVP